jgi:hypothetical protein
MRFKLLAQRTAVIQVFADFHRCFGNFAACITMNRWRNDLKEASVA